MLEDYFPIPRIDKCIDKIGKAKYVTEGDLLNGFWHIPFIYNAKEVSAFVTLERHFQYKVMQFGMKTLQPHFRDWLTVWLMEQMGFGLT